MAEMKRILDSRPSSSELLRKVRLGPTLYAVGDGLDLDKEKLNEIRCDSDTIENKNSRMYQLWLESKPNATRRELIEVLEDLGINDKAVQYKKYIGKVCCFCDV